MVPRLPVEESESVRCLAVWAVAFTSSILMASAAALAALVALAASARVKASTKSPQST